MNSSKNEEGIRFLKGPDRVRCRAAVYFWSDDIEGVITAFQMLFDIFGMEAYRGNSKQIELTINDDQSFVIKSYDQGIELGQDDNDIKESRWYHLFCELYDIDKLATVNSCRRSGFLDYQAAIYGENEGKFDTFENEFVAASPLCEVQYVSEYMDVEVVKKGEKKNLHFEKGYAVGGLTVEPCNGSSSTQIVCKFDKEIFPDICIPESVFINIMDKWTMLVPGFQCDYKNNVTGTEATIVYPGGIDEFVMKKSQGNMESSVFSNSIHARGKERYNREEYDAEISVALQFTNADSLSKYYHNFQEIEYGGKHVWAIIKRIHETLFHFIGDRYVPDSITEPYDRNTWCEKHQITRNELLQHLIIVVETKCSPGFTRWETGSRQSIVNTMITDMAFDSVGKSFEDYIYRNEDFVIGIVENILNERE